MSIDEIKKEIKSMDDSVLQELTSFILQVRRLNDPARKEEITQLLDSPSSKWVTLDEMDRRLGSN